MMEKSATVRKDRMSEDMQVSNNAKRGIFTNTQVGQKPIFYLLL